MKPNPRRIAAIVGALAVAGVTATGVIVGTASAAGTGTCTSSVNVRSEPSETAPIVGVCERGESTSVGSARGGFVELPEFGGWAVADYVSTSSSAPSNTTDSTGSDDELAPSSSSERSSSPSTTASPSADEEGTGTGRSASPSSGESSERSGTSTSPSSAGSSQAPSGESFFDEG